jgi:hypothetical protein
MKLPAKIVVWLLPLFLTACIHREQAQVQPLGPPIEDNPPPPPSTAPVNLPPPVVTIPAEPTKPAPTPPPKPPAKHRKKPTSPPASTNPQEAANAAPAPNPGVSAIGELSSGDPANYRKETEDSIASIERGLNGITRPLNDTEQKTADHIRDFLKQARTALASGDVDGAHTLSEKAKVLLAELIQ